MPTNHAQDAADAARVRVRTFIVPPVDDRHEPMAHEPSGNIRPLTDTEWREYDPMCVPLLKLGPGGDFVKEIRP